MAKQITFSYNGKDYTLEFTRASVRQMESTGFVADDLEHKPMIVLPALFAGAFIAHHKFEKRNVIDEIYEKMTDKQLLIDKLGEMYTETVHTLFEEPCDDEGKVRWTSMG